ncbi:unnamed protein product [Rhizophagus irregularis]|nr:unnamed protein product [Rhizophagus irregularis]
MTRFNSRRRRSNTPIDSLNREVESGSLPPSVRNHVFSRIARGRNKYLRNDIIYERLFMTKDPLLVGCWNRVARCRRHVAEDIIIKYI